MSNIPAAAAATTAKAVTKATTAATAALTSEAKIAPRTFNQVRNLCYLIAIFYGLRRGARERDDNNRAWESYNKKVWAENENKRAAEAALARQNERKKAKITSTHGGEQGKQGNVTTATATATAVEGVGKKDPTLKQETVIVPELLTKGAAVDSHSREDTLHDEEREENPLLDFLPSELKLIVNELSQE